MEKPGRPTSPNVLVVARNLAADAVTAEVVRALRNAGIRSILLKGASLAAWLYDDDLRPYLDSDLLVHPEDIGPAEAVLSELGFVHPPLDHIPHDRPWHARFWVRNSGGAVDLHRTLIGAEAPPTAAWEALSEKTEVMQVGGLDVEVLAKPARALHVALHAAQDGVRVGKPLVDLARAVERVPLEIWQEAAELAARLDALQAFATGLRLIPSGEALAASLHLPVDTSVEVALRASAAPPQSLGVEWLARTPGVKGKVALLASKLFPPPEFMRVWSPWARRGGSVALAAAYLWRPIWLLLHAGPAVRAWYRAKKAVS